MVCKGSEGSFGEWVPLGLDAVAHKPLPLSGWGSREVNAPNFGTSTFTCYAISLSLIFITKGNFTGWHTALEPLALPTLSMYPSGFHSCRPDLYFPLSISHTKASQVCAPMGCFHKAALVTSVATSMGTCTLGIILSAWFPRSQRERV